MTDGGPAFPCSWDAHGMPSINGMSLRDYLAAAALQGMCAGITRFRSDEPAKTAGIIINRPNDLSELAYTYADAMLAEREKK